MLKFINYKNEVIWVEKFTRYDSWIIVHYKGAKYKCTKNVFGTKLFPIDSATKNYLKSTLNIDIPSHKNQSKIKIGQTIIIKNCSTNETLTVKIGNVHMEKTYKRMGGSYYGNSLDISYIGDDISLENGIYNISAFSPLAKSILSKYCGMK